MKLKRSELSELIREVTRQQLKLKQNVAGRARSALAVISGIFDQTDHKTARDKERGQAVVPAEGSPEGHMTVDLIKDIEDGNVGKEHGLQGWYAQVLRAVLLFTGAHVPTVRQPSQYNPDKSGPLNVTSLGSSSFDDTHYINYQPEKEHYEDARKIMYALSVAQPFPSFVLKSHPTHAAKFDGSIYRGMRLTPQEIMAVMGANSLILRDISSATIDPVTAKHFMMMGTADRKRELGTYFVIKKPTHGTYVGGSSAYDSEYEAVISGTLNIDEIELSFYQAGVDTGGFPTLGESDYALLKKKLFKSANANAVYLFEQSASIKQKAAVNDFIRKLCDAVPNDVRGFLSIAFWVQTNYLTDQWPYKDYDYNLNTRGTMSDRQLADIQQFASGGELFTKIIVGALKRRPDQIVFQFKCTLSL